MNTEERAHLEQGLSTTVKRHMDEFRKQREEWEQQKAAEVAVKREEEAKGLRDKYEKLIELQVEDAQDKVASRKLRNRILGAILALLTTAGGSGAWMAAQPGAPKVEPGEVKDAVQSSQRASESRFQEAEEKIERLGTASVNAQVTQSAGVEYIVDKIDAASPKAADKIDEPPTIEAARIRAEAITKKKRTAAVLGTTYDPFDDLPKP